MSREKQIEEMVAVVRNNTESCKTCTWYKEGLCMEDCELEEDNQKICTDLYEAGYRKQIEGEWLTDRFGMDRSVCSVCGAVFEGDGGNYCRKCGAKMKGGGEG